MHKIYFRYRNPFWKYRITKKLLTKIINSNVKTAKTSFFATVRLIQTNYYGGFVQAKNSVFSEDEILETIYKLEQKNNGFYLNSDIWDSIVKIERSKVSNKIRFQIYERDGYRCRKCGSTENLEIDHIYPISKGGKTELSNLQTLCRNCNLKKGNSVY